LRERYRRQGKRFVYLDESGFEHTVERRYAYAPKGDRVHGLICAHRRPRTSLLAARTPNGFEATMLFEGTCNSLVFNMWLEKELCPLLNKQHVVIMDNVPFHKSQRTRELIEGQGATLLFLPPYSPDLNPIEHDFANIKKRREYANFLSLDTIVAMYQ
jgi:transposase